MDDRIIREEECKKLTGSSRSTRYRWEKHGLFPIRKILGPNSVGWLLSEIQDWIKSRSNGLRIDVGNSAKSSRNCQ